MLLQNDKFSTTTNFVLKVAVILFICANFSIVYCNLSKEYSTTGEFAGILIRWITKGKILFSTVILTFISIKTNKWLAKLIHKDYWYVITIISVFFLFGFLNLNICKSIYQNYFKTYLVMQNENTFLQPALEHNFQEKQLKKERLVLGRFLQNHVSSIERDFVWKAANDSIKSWVNNSLEEYKIYQNYWYLDSLICFNSKNNRAVLALGYQLSEKDNHDGIDYFYGIKMKGEWYFFKGPNIMLSRKAYQKNERTPIPFKTFENIAMQEIFRGYLKKNWKGKWEINDKFFADLTSTAWWLDGVEPKNQEEWNKVYLRIIQENWRKE